MQPGERQFHLGLDTRSACHPAVRCMPYQVLDQRCLAHPGFTVYGQRPALTGADGTQELIERGTFRVPAYQPPPTPPDQGARSFLHKIDVIPTSGQRTGHGGWPAG